jgi:glycosyltransferase involved in cell wall biosynthesis
VAGIPDVIRDGHDGVLVPPAAAAALADALRRLLADSARRAQLGTAARRTVAEELSWDRAARRFEECYAQATALVAG